MNTRKRISIIVAAMLLVCGLAHFQPAWPQIHIAEELLVDLDARDASAGEAEWINNAPE